MRRGSSVRALPLVLFHTITAVIIWVPYDGTTRGACGSIEVVNDRLYLTYLQCCASAELYATSTTP